MLKNADPAIERHMNIVNIGYFITSLLRAYRTEQLIRIEALRLMYAGNLLENNEKVLSDSARYRIITQVIESINPMAPQTLIDATYLDTIWRSPSGLWVILLDACRVRGIFGSALRLPPIDCIQQLCGGYQSQGQKYVYPTLFQRFAAYAPDFQSLSTHLLAIECHEIRAVGVQILSVLQTDLTAHNVLMLVNVMKNILIQSITQLFGLIAATSFDPSTLDVHEFNDSSIHINKQWRLPVDIYLDCFDGLMETISKLLGWLPRARQTTKISSKKVDGKMGK